MLVILLLVAAAISAVLWFHERETTAPYEAMTILVVVILNAAIGYIQRAHAKKALTALSNMSAARANVVRDGARMGILARDVVPDDIVVLEEGDTIPADGRIIEAVSLRTAEAALTGELIKAYPAKARSIEQR